MSSLTRIAAAPSFSTKTWDCKRRPQQQKTPRYFCLFDFENDVHPRQLLEKNPAMYTVDNARLVQ